MVASERDMAEDSWLDVCPTGRPDSWSAVMSFRTGLVWTRLRSPFALGQQVRFEEVNITKLNSWRNSVRH